MQTYIDKFKKITYEVVTMKKVLCFFLMLIITFSCAFCSFATFDSGELTESIESPVYYLQSLDEDTVFFQKDADKKVPAAAFVKLLSAIVATEKWPNLDEKVKVTKDNLSLVKYDYGVRTALYKAGEEVSKRELLNCLMVYSANDAASIIAYEISGSLDKFIQEMTAVASKAGCTSTVIKNIHGFDEEGQYTTAKDIAAIIKYGLQYQAFSDSFSMTSVTLSATEQNNERTYTSSNKMKNATIPDYYHSAVTGGKHTSTEKAGECIAVVSNKDGYSYLTVVLGSKLKDIDNDNVNENTSMTDAKKLLNWVYDNIRYRAVVSPTQTVSVVDVVAGKGKDSLRLIPEKEKSALVPSKVTSASVLFEIVEGTVPETVKAPIKAGDYMGQAEVYYAGTLITTINLVAAEDIELSTPRLIMSGISNIVGSKAFLIISGLAFTLCLLYLCYYVMNTQKAKKLLKEKLARQQQMKNRTQRTVRGSAPQKRPVQRGTSQQRNGKQK